MSAVADDAESGRYIPELHDPQNCTRSAPDTVVQYLLKGERGPEFEVNSDLSEVQKGRLFLGLGFPQELHAAVL